MSSQCKENVKKQKNNNNNRTSSSVQVSEKWLQLFAALNTFKLWTSDKQLALIKATSWTRVFFLYRHFRLCFWEIVLFTSRHQRYLKHCQGHDERNEETSAKTKPINYKTITSEKGDKGAQILCCETNSVCLVHVWKQKLSFRKPFENEVFYLKCSFLNDPNTVCVLPLACTMVSYMHFQMYRCGFLHVPLQLSFVSKSFHPCEFSCVYSNLILH